MALDKNDLLAIRTVVREEIQAEIAPIKKEIAFLKAQIIWIKKQLKKMDDKFVRFFNFLDGDWSRLARRIDMHDRHANLDTKALTDPSRIS